MVQISRFEEEKIKRLEAQLAASKAEESQFKQEACDRAFELLIHFRSGITPEQRNAKSLKARAMIQRHLEASVAQGGDWADAKFIQALNDEIGDALDPLCRAIHAQFRRHGFKVLSSE